MEKPIISQRPWGKFTQFCQNKSDVTVKIIDVRPGEQLSKKRHRYRDEFWIALDRGLVALVGEESVPMKDLDIEASPIWIPKGTIHSVKNTTAGLNAKFLEISYGDFDEEDNERITDVYGRVCNG